jgi:hypothetical protein
MVSSYIFARSSEHLTNVSSDVDSNGEVRGEQCDKISAKARKDDDRCAQSRDAAQSAYLAASEVKADRQTHGICITCTLILYEQG